MRIDALELDEGSTIAQEEGTLTAVQTADVPREGVDTGLQTADLIAEDSDDLTALLYLLLDGAQGLLLIARITAQLLELLVRGFDGAKELLTLLLEALEGPGLTPLRYSLWGKGEETAREEQGEGEAVPQLMAGVGDHSDGRSLMSSVRLIRL